MDFNTPLNPFFDNIFADQLDRRSVDTNTTRYDMIERSANRQFKIDYLDGSAVYKAIVLHVYRDGEDPGYWAQASQLVRRTLGLQGGRYYRIRARIPELHAHIPVPCRTGTDETKNRAIIEMHPVFVSRADSISTTLDVGDIVRVSFTKGPKYGLQAGGILHDKYAAGTGGTERGPGDTSCEELTERFDPNTVARVTTLGNSFPSDEEEDEIREELESGRVVTELAARSRKYAQNPAKATEIDVVFQYGPTTSPVAVTSEFGPRCPPCIKWLPGRGPSDEVRNQDGTTRAGGKYPVDCKDFGSANHGGIDLDSPQGSAVRAPFSGEVMFAGAAGGAGNMITIGYKDPANESLYLRYQVDYLHLSAFAEGIASGVSVQPGDHLGNVGSTGNVSGPHLHVAVRDSGTRVNPRDYFPVGSFTNNRPGSPADLDLADPDRRLNPPCNDTSSRTTGTAEAPEGPPQ